MPLATVAGNAILGNQARQDAKGAAGRSQAAQDQARAEAKQYWQPYMQAGSEGLSGMQAMNAPGYQMQVDPGYQFAVDQGTKALNRAAAAGGFLNSGRLGQALTKYGQDMATGQFENRYNRMLGLANMGQNAAESLTGGGQNYANATGNIQGNLNQARQQYWNDMASSISQAAQNAGNMYAMNSMGLFGGGSGGGGGPSGTAIQRSRSYSSSPIGYLR